MVGEQLQQIKMQSAAQSWYFRLRLREKEKLHSLKNNFGFWVLGPAQSCMKGEALSIKIPKEEY